MSRSHCTLALPQSHSVVYIYIRKLRKHSTDRVLLPIRSSGYHGHEDTKLPQNMMASPRTSISHLPHSQPHNMTTLPQLSPHHQNHYMVYGPPLVMQPQQLHHPPMSMNAPLVNPRKRRRSDEPESMGPPATPAISSSSYNFSPGPMPTSSHEGAPAAKPKTKRTRTNIPWTPAEEQQLKRLRDGGNSWSDIAKVRISDD